MERSNELERIYSVKAFKALSEPLRLSILEQLMYKPATLSQLGRIHGAHPAKIRYHLKLLEKAGLVSLDSTNVVGGFVEKYYRASAKAYQFNKTILPKSSAEHSMCLMGSHDLALSLFANHLRDLTSPIDLQTIFVGSLEGLVALQQGACQLAGSHLRDQRDGQYNVNFVRTLFPGTPMIVASLAEREQGLIYKAGNPLGISDLSDLSREGLHLVNRQPGSGTRVWLDQKLESGGIDTRTISGYDQSVNSNLHVARAVVAGEANTRLGLLAAARVFDLGFLPLFQERYDLVLPATALEDSNIQKMLEQLTSGEFREQIEALGGYDTRCTGEIQRINANN
jgi:molybdate-binding protein